MAQQKIVVPDAFTRDYETTVTFTLKRYQPLRVELPQVEAMLRELEQQGARMVSRPPASPRLSMPKIIAQTLATRGVALAFDELYKRATALRPIKRRSLRITVTRLVGQGKVIRIGSGASARYKAA